MGIIFCLLLRAYDELLKYVYVFLYVIDFEYFIRK